MGKTFPGGFLQKPTDELSVKLDVALRVQAWLLAGLLLVTAGPLAAQEAAKCEQQTSAAEAGLRRQNEEVFRSFLRALNLHDVDAQFRHYAPEMVYLEGNRRMKPDKERERSDREFEAANHAQWSYEVLGRGADRLDLVVTEDMDFYRLLGAGARSHHARYRFRDGKIVEAEAWDWAQEGKPYESTRDRFVQWVLRDHPEVVAHITEDDHLVFTSAAAPLINQLVREWRSEVFPEDVRSARAVLTAILDTLGGADRLASLTHWYVKGHGRENLTAQLQGIRPDLPTWRSHEEKFAVETQTLSVSWERRTPRNDNSLRWRRLVYKPDAFGFVDWDGDRGVLRPSPVPESRRRALARRVPHLLLLEAATQAMRTLPLGTRMIDGQPHDEIEVELPDGVFLVLVVAEKPALLRGVEYFTYMPGRGDVTVAWEWPAWNSDAQLRFVPSGHRLKIADETFQEVTYSEYSASSQAAAELLEVPARFLQPEEKQGVSGALPRGEPAKPPLPATGLVAPGVLVGDVQGFREMAVEFRDFVVVFDAPEQDPGFEAIPSAGSHGEITGEYLGLIKKTFPGKPVRYMVLSHHHGDHMGGLPAFASDGATLLVAPGECQAVVRALEAPHTLAQGFRAGLASEVRVEAIADRKVLMDSMRTVEILNVGSNPHTAENLVLWLPAERILMQGDLFYYSEGERSLPPGRATMNRFFAHWLNERGIHPRAVYGVHNRGAAGPEQLADAARLPVPTP